MSGARPRTGDVAPDGRIYIRLDEEDDVPPPEKPPFECAAGAGPGGGRVIAAEPPIRQRWPKAAKAALRDCWGKMSLSEIAQNMGRSEGSVQRMAVRMHLASPHCKNRVNPFESPLAGERGRFVEPASPFVGRCFEDDPRAPAREPPWRGVPATRPVSFCGSAAAMCAERGTAIE